MVSVLKYQDGAICVLWNGSKLSCNLPGISKNLNPGLFCVKNWSENEQLAKDALASGLFEETDITFPTGYVDAPVWRIK